MKSLWRRSYDDTHAAPPSSFFFRDHICYSNFCFALFHTRLFKVNDVFAEICTVGISTKRQTVTLRSTPPYKIPLPSI